MMKRVQNIFYYMTNEGEPRTDIADVIATANDTAKHELREISCYNDLILCMQIYS